jgi:hypothetical protein
VLPEWVDQRHMNVAFYVTPSISISAHAQHGAGRRYVDGKLA